MFPRAALAIQMELRTTLKRGGGERVGGLTMRTGKDLGGSRLVNKAWGPLGMKELVKRKTNIIIFYYRPLEVSMKLVNVWFGFLHLANPQQGDLRLSVPPSGQGAGARTRDRKVPAVLRADSLATETPTHPQHLLFFPPGLSGPPSGQGASGGARARKRRVPADLRADSPSTVPQTLSPEKTGR
ncbi:hypothetical protein PoB_007720500 [Plakobranchus ocellatus]|uniref:Uncharacterized protein n=1 Tax=Plakobranchus ocellatus TaxID=259542 RepID=A0AAV4E387_9GAST|nr:hypothetical protein PoB_007720500 [Plakobranchus ocellatus]